MDAHRHKLTGSRKTKAAIRVANTILDSRNEATLAMRWLIPRLVDLQTRHPHIVLRLTADDGMVDFTRHRFDLAIRVGHDPWGAADVTELLPDMAGPVLSPKLPPVTGFSEAKILWDLPTLHTKTRPSAWDEWCVQTGLPSPGSGREFENFYFMLEAATAGLCVGIAPEVLVRDDLAAGRLIAPFGFAATGRTYVALKPQALIGMQRRC